MLNRINEAVSFIKSKTDRTPSTGVILGSGLGIYVDTLEDKIEIPYSEIPGFATTTVVGHAGKLVFGKSNTKDVVVMQGRYHAYEGHDAAEVAFPTRVLGKLGIKNLVLTNASGGINSSYRPGELVYIQDQINLTGRNPLIGDNIEELGPRFPDMTYAYKPHLNEYISAAAKDLGFEIKSGIYAGLMGPTYETPAEIKMLRTMGADMVGMSTVFENIAANHMGINVCGISCITNMAAGMLDEKLDHADVKDIANQAMEKFAKLVNKLIEKID
ncbi:MAG: purine-nucleoside phosphorylase [Bacteriovoracaceae bacterium]|jgi:purine-nucleoside phosphorylase|nr:purine-nucleoside phosphorylase [Bacteriovoracaceae bacterium]